MLKSVQYMCGKHCGSSAPLYVCVCVKAVFPTHIHSLIHPIWFYLNLYLSFVFTLLLPFRFSFYLWSTSRHTRWHARPCLFCICIPSVDFFSSAASFMMSAENAALDFSHSGKVSRMRRQLVVKGCSRDLLEALWSFFVRKLISQFMSYVCW